MGTQEEVNAFVEQALKKYEEANRQFGGKHFVKDTWLEKPMRKNISDFYLQMKFICENLGREIIIEKESSFEKGMLVFRRGNILHKIVFTPWYQVKELKENPIFSWQEYKAQLTMEEYIDIVMSEIGSTFEYYHSYLQNNEAFNCTELARRLGLNGIISQVDKAENLKQLYETLGSATARTYGIKTDTLFPQKSYDVRCAVAHMDYHYEKINPGNFKIFLNVSKTKEIMFDELIQLTIDIITKINIIKTIPFCFSNPDFGLPLTGF